MKTCEQEGCELKVHGRGLCSRHYAAARDSGAFLTENGTCSRCDQPLYAKGLCRSHYRSERHKRGVVGVMTCTQEGCDVVVHARTLCLKHYNAARASGQFGAPKCEREWCTRVVYAKRLCSKHYQMARRIEAGAPLRERNVSPWRPNARGYLVRHVPLPDGSWRRELQHRVVMEQVIGRPLLPHENVHHLNGVKDDNRPENLELWSKSQPPGQRVEDKIAWAREFLADYGLRVT